MDSPSPHTDLSIRSKRSRSLSSSDLKQSQQLPPKLEENLLPKWDPDPLSFLNQTLPTPIPKPKFVRQYFTVDTKPKGYDYYRYLGSPKYCVAPMVHASELAFRMLCRSEMAHLAHTPMIFSTIYCAHPKNQLQYILDEPEDRPLIAQICGSNVEDCVACAKILEKKCDGIELNLGCPQSVAKRGNYGAFLATNDRPMVYKIVSKLHETISVPILCKIRLFDTFEETWEFISNLVASGCQMLTIHGRTKEQKGEHICLADWETIRVIRNRLPNLPIIANGNIRNLADVHNCLKFTGCDGVMSATGLLRDPCLFSGKLIPAPERARRYIHFALKYTAPSTELRRHVFSILAGHFCYFPDIRQEFIKLPILDDPIIPLEIRRQSISKIFTIIDKIRDRLDQFPTINKYVVSSFKGKAVETKLLEHGIKLPPSLKSDNSNPDGTPKTAKQRRLIRNRAKKQEKKARVKIIKTAIDHYSTHNQKS